MKLQKEYISIKSHFDTGKNKASISSCSEEDIKELVNQLNIDGYSVYYKKNDIASCQWVIKRQEESKEISVIERKKKVADSFNKACDRNDVALKKLSDN